MASKFTRKASAQLITKLRGEPLFKNKLLNDCMNEKVFMAIRNEVIDFYYKGGRLFEYDFKDGFKTHIKYAAVIDYKVEYLTQTALSKPVKPDFLKHYERIKENCSKYSGIEALGVSDIYHKHSYLSKTDNVIVLDIEASFASIKKNKKSDRIDIVLYDKINQRIYFVEAKHFSNPEIWSSGKPKVIGQILGYEHQIIQKSSRIISQYKEYITSLYDIFGIQIPEPIEVDKKVILLVFGFDSYQRKKIKNLIDGNKNYQGIKYYSVGGTRTLIMDHILTQAKIL